MLQKLTNFLNSLTLDRGSIAVPLLAVAAFFCIGYAIKTFVESRHLSQFANELDDDFQIRVTSMRELKKTVKRLKQCGFTEAGPENSLVNWASNFAEIDVMITPVHRGDAMPHFTGSRYEQFLIAGPAK